MIALSAWKASRAVVQVKAKCFNNSVLRGRGLRRGFLLHGTHEFGYKRLSSSKAAKERRRIRPWSREEDELLTQLRSEGKSWPDIYKTFPSRSFAAVHSRLSQKKLRSERQVPKAPTARRQRWTEEDDLRLRELREKGIPIHEIATHFPGRSATSVQVHYYQKVSPELEADSVKLSRKGWNLPELEKLVQLRHDRHESFVTIARLLGRSLNSVWAAYHKHVDSKLRPYIPRKHEYSAEEQQRMLQLYRSGLLVDQIAQMLSAQSNRSVDGTKVHIYDALHSSGGTPNRTLSKKQRAVMVEEITALRRQGIPWKTIASRYPGRSASSLQLLVYRESRKKG